MGSKDQAQVARLTWQAIYLASHLSGPQLLALCKLDMGPGCRLGVVRNGFFGSYVVLGLMCGPAGGVTENKVMKLSVPGQWKYPLGIF